MSSRKITPTKNSSRPRTSVEATRKSRHTSKTQPGHINTSFSSHVSSGMTQSNFVYAMESPDFYSENNHCWPVMTDNFFPGNDSAHIPMLSVAPTDLTNQPCWQGVARYDAESSSSSSGSSKSNVSPLMSEVEIYDVYQPTVDQFGYCYEPIVHEQPPTPPEDHMFEMFGNNKNDYPGFASCPEAPTQCEFLGESKLQFYSAPSRHTQPRPIRSASERSPVSPSSGSPYLSAKDDHSDRVKHNPRNDPRYEEKADKDGLFHCPYFADGLCNHKATKQKCIYAKNLDSHLKPYTCKHGETDEGCRSLRFSSNACLFRHEREMHGLHNHGMNPYLCKFDGCERARSDNGFPRRWNQRDHMKRVHGHEEVDSDESADRGYTDSSARRKKSSSSSHHVPMKRTGSSRAQNNYFQAAPRHMSGPRHVVQSPRGHQARNVMIQGMTSQAVSYTSQQIMDPPYGNYMQSVY